MGRRLRLPPFFVARGLRAVSPALTLPARRDSQIIMSKAKPGASLLLILIFLAGLFVPVPECFVTRLFCPQAKAFACPDSPDRAPRVHGSLAACCAKPQPSVAVQARPRLAELRPWMRPYAPEREIVQAPALPTALLPSPFFKPAQLDFSPFALTTLDPGLVPEPVPILLNKQSFLI